MRNLLRRLFPITLVAIVLVPQLATASDEITISSKALGESRIVDVQLPENYATSGETYPVVYALDGDHLFAPVAAMAHWLAYVTRTPGLIVVGIRNTHRTHDFTTPWSSSIKPSDSLAWMVPNSGGADAFLTFLAQELQPEIEQRYRAAPLRIGIGHSLGGLLMLHAVAARPDVFQAAIVISPPSAWNDDEVIRALRAAGALDHTRALFLAAAGNDPADTTPAFHRLVETLNGRPAGLRWNSEIFPTEDHGTVALPAIQAGLQFIFSKWRVPGYVSDSGLSAINDYYASLSKFYGYPVRFQEGEMARLAGQWLRSKKTEEAVSLYQIIVREHPDSANARDDLGSALLAAGHAAEAREAFDQAVALGTRNHDPATEIYKTHREKAKE